VIVLDTNVLSEPLKTSPALNCLRWLDEQAAETLYISTVSYAELWIGVLRLPDGKRKKDLAASVQAVLELFRQRTLTFDVAAAQELARIAVHAAKAGHRVHAPDAYIAACAAAHGFAVATRNAKHFAHTGVATVNPWS
jgi:predicted nucleic acid-binding protein